MPVRWPPTSPTARSAVGVSGRSTVTMVRSVKRSHTARALTNHRWRVVVGAEPLERAHEVIDRGEHGLAVQVDHRRGQRRVARGHSRRAVHRSGGHRQQRLGLQRERGGEHVGQVRHGGQRPVVAGGMDRHRLGAHDERQAAHGGDAADIGAVGDEHQPRRARGTAPGRRRSTPTRSVPAIGWLDTKLG